MFERITITYTCDFGDEEEVEDERKRLENVLPDVLGTQDIEIEFEDYSTTSCIRFK